MRMIGLYFGFRFVLEAAWLLAVLLYGIGKLIDRFR